MIQRMRHTKWLAALVLVSSFGMLRARDASSEPNVADGAPSGMVVFVGGGVCPPGWMHASDLEGRAIVGTVTKEDVGVDVGTPFGDREERVHSHDYTGTVQLTSKGIVAANGPENTIAAPGSYSIAGATTENATGLPFFQMEGCIKP
jgi:hypothetical protein